MNHKLYSSYLNILKTELVVAMGCTEPIAVAYAASIAKSYFKGKPDTIKLVVSGNIIKNVKSVVIPHTGGMKGLVGALSAGFVAGDASKELEVIAYVSKQQIEDMKTFMNETEFIVEQSESECQFDIQITVSSSKHHVFVNLLD